MPQKLVRDPIYKQLNDALRELIRNREYVRGDRFLSEREVGERFRVSRATANKALSTLVAEGVLRFEKGIGTFVAGPKLDYDLRALVSFGDKVRAAGKVPSTRVLSAESVLAGSVDPGVMGHLGVDAEERVLSLERVRCADGQPVIFERRYVNAHFCPDLLERDLSGSLYALWTEHYGLAINGAEQAVSAVSTLPEEASVLGLEAGAACLLLSCRGLLRSGATLWFERTLYRGDVYEFVSQLGPVSMSSPGEWAFRRAR